MSVSEAYSFSIASIDPAGCPLHRNCSVVVPRVSPHRVTRVAGGGSNGTGMVREMKPFLVWVARSGKRIAVSAIGLALIVVGLVLLVLPGPGILVVLAGLAVLGTEYAWARRALDETRKRARSAASRLRRRHPAS